MLSRGYKVCISIDLIRLMEKAKAILRGVVYLYMHKYGYKIIGPRIYTHVFTSNSTSRENIPKPISYFHSDVIYLNW